MSTKRGLTTAVPGPCYGWTWGTSLAPAGWGWKVRLPGKLGFAFSFRFNQSLNLDRSRFPGFASGFKILLRGEAVFQLSVRNAQLGAFLSCPAAASIRPTSAPVLCPRAETELGHGVRGRTHRVVCSPPAQPQRETCPDVGEHQRWTLEGLCGLEPAAAVSAWGRQHWGCGQQKAFT